MTKQKSNKEIIRFPKGNKIKYGQDFRFFKGIPDDIDFEVERVGDNTIRLTADGYGNMKKKNKYGNGALYVSKEDLPKQVVLTDSNKLNRKNVEKIMYKRLKLTHNKSKIHCLSEKTLEDRVNQILSLIPEEGEVIAGEKIVLVDGSVDRDPFGNLWLGNLRDCEFLDKIEVFSNNKKIQIIIKEVK